MGRRHDGVGVVTFPTVMTLRTMKAVQGPTSFTGC